MDHFKFKKDGLNIISEVARAKAKYPVISECPVCHHDLMVQKLTCEHCGTSVEGEFVLSKFNYLDMDKLYFIEIFVKNRGNIKAIEKEMDLSYPTIKKMLDDVIVGLGYNLDNDPEEPKEEQAKPKQSKVEILDKISKGELSVSEAAELLKKLK